jgi:hypothetical protein
MIEEVIDEAEGMREDEEREAGGSSDIEVSIRIWASVAVVGEEEVVVVVVEVDEEGA